MGKKEANSKWYFKNRERILEDERIAYDADPSKKLASAKSYYLNNHERCLANARARRLRWEPIRKFVADYKTRPCADCGLVFHPFAMDFDHVRGEKIGDVSAMLSRLLPFGKIWAEIEKCDVVCACCHRMRTWNRSVADGI